MLPAKSAKVAKKIVMNSLKVLVLCAPSHSSHILPLLTVGPTTSSKRDNVGVNEVIDMRAKMTWRSIWKFQILQF